MADSAIQALDQQSKALAQGVEFCREQFGKSTDKRKTLDKTYEFALKAVKEVAEQVNLSVGAVEGVLAIQTGYLDTIQSDFAALKKILKLGRDQSSTQLVAQTSLIR